ncbi:hypothetical protein T439DRAFT_327824 [Meredithblackwellia eburnea MCA 4105]
MPSFSSAIKTLRTAQPASDGSTIYNGVVDLEWSVFGAPHGGYLLACIVNCTTDFMKEAGSKQVDPAHLMSSFLRAAVKGPYEVHVRMVKKGARWTNLEAKMFQNGSLLIVSQALYTEFPALPDNPQSSFSDKNQNLLPGTPSPYAYRSPFLTHPSKCDPVPVSNEQGRRWSSESVLFFIPSSLKWSEDPGLRAKREGSGNEWKEGKRLELEWGAWCEFTRPEDEVDTNSLLFFADIFSSIPELLPPDEKVTPHYYPTLAMSIQFHARLPLPSSFVSSRTTVGCYSTGYFIHDGRHEQLSQVWSAPSRIEEGEEEDGWREKSMILLTATQIALSVGLKALKPRPSRDSIL